MYVVASCFVALHQCLAHATWLVHSFIRYCISCKFIAFAAAGTLAAWAASQLASCVACQTQESYFPSWREMGLV